MKVDELAEELGCDSAAVVRLCRDRNIRASWGGSELDDDAVAAVRAAFAAPAETADAAPAGGEASRPVPAAVAATPSATSDAAPSGPPPAPAGRFSVPPEGTSALDAVPDGARGAAPGGAAHRPARPVDRIRAPQAERAALWAAVAGATGLVWALARLLPDWDEGRWWGAPVALGAFTLVAALVAVLLAVRGIGEVLSHRSTRYGIPTAVVALVVSTTILGGAVLLAVYDWNALDVPAAYDRLQLGKQKGGNAGDLLDRIENQRVADLADVTGVPVANLRPGMCIGSTLESDRERVATIGCDIAHDGEVVGVVTLSSGPYPGLDATKSQARKACKGPFLAYVGVDPDQSRYDLKVFAPSQIQWTSGQRTVVCVATSPNGSTGTARGRGR